MRRINVEDMTVTEQLENIRETICEKYCKYTEQYRSCIKDPMEADEKKIADMCHFCIMGRL